MAEPVPIEVPAGYLGNGTPYSARGRYADGNHVRFRNGFATPIGGWTRRTRGDTGADIDPVFAGAPGVEVARNVVAWVDNSGAPHIVVGTNRGLYHVSSVGVVSNITPTVFIPGNADSSEIVGYGVGLYGRGPYGTRRQGTGFALEPVASWSLALFGEVLLAQFRDDGPLHQWRPGTDVVAIPLTGPPANAQGVIVTSERMVMTIHRQPRTVSWSDVESLTNWTPTVTNQAGSQQLGGEGELRAHRQIGRDILILSTRDAHLGKYIGPPFVYGFEQVGQNCGTIAPASLVVAAGRGYWIGPGGFWTYDGSVRRLTSEIDDWIRERFSQPQVSKCSGFLQPGYREIWWLFQTQSGSDCDAYVVYNYDDNTWSRGAIERTVGLTPGPSNDPLMIDYQGVLWNHEITGTLPVPPPWIETGPLEVANGNQQVGVQWLYPDAKAFAQGSADGLVDTNATLTILGKDWPSPDEPERAYGPYTLTRPVPTTGARGRELRIRIDSVSSRWVAGRHRLKLVGLGGTLMALAPSRGPSALDTRSPDPRRYDSWQDYAFALGAWQDKQRLVSMGTQPEAVMLLGVSTTDMTGPRPLGGARATAPGLLVFDPGLKRARLSCNGAWYSLAIEGTPP